MLMQDALIAASLRLSARSDGVTCQIRPHPSSGGALRGQTPPSDIYDSNPRQGCFLESFHRSAGVRANKGHCDKMGKIISVVTLAYSANKQIYRVIYSEISRSDLLRLIRDRPPDFCSIMRERTRNKKNCGIDIRISFKSMGLRIYISDAFNWLITIYAHADFSLAILMRPRGIQELWS